MSHPAPDLSRRFTYHPVTDDGRAAAHDQVRTQCLALAHELDLVLLAGREKSLAIPKLEEVMFWGNAAIAREPADAHAKGAQRPTSRHVDTPLREVYFSGADGQVRVRSG